jgi:hypothetical protein
MAVRRLEGGFMSKESTVSVREMEQESAELLPSRETLQVTNWWPYGRGHFRGRFHFRGRHFHFRDRYPYWW